jgi:hypothetical protein
MTKLTAGPVGVGSVFRTKELPPRNTPWFMKVFWPLLGKLMGVMDYTEAEIMALEPNRRVAWKAALPKKNGDFFAKAEWEINLAHQGEDTLVTQGVHFQFFGKMAERMDPEKPAQDVGEETAANLAQLKSIVEARTASAAAPNQVAFT